MLNVNNRKHFFQKVITIEEIAKYLIHILGPEIKIHVTLLSARDGLLNQNFQQLKKTNKQTNKKVNVIKFTIMSAK